MYCSCSTAHVKFIPPSLKQSKSSNSSYLLIPAWDKRTGWPCNYFFISWRTSPMRIGRYDKEIPKVESRREVTSPGWWIWMKLAQHEELSDILFKDWARESGNAEKQLRGGYWLREQGGVKRRQPSEGGKGRGKKVGWRGWLKEVKAGSGERRRGGERGSG